MRSSQIDQDDPRIQAALVELRGLIQARFPEATFDVSEGDDPAGIYLDATVDTDSMFDVLDLVSDRVVDFQVDDGLPIYVIPLRPPERVAAMLREMPPVRRRRRLSVADVLTTPVDEARPTVRRAASGG